jgi:hypothetical protein
MEDYVKLFRIFCLTGIFMMTLSTLATARADVSGLFAASAAASQETVQENAAPPDISGAWHLFWTALNGTEHQGTMQINQNGKTFGGTIKGGGHGTIRLKGTLDGNQISIALKVRRKHFLFNGMIDGDKMSGTSQQGVAWSATRLPNAASDLPSSPAAPKRTAVVLRFAVQSQMMPDTPALSAQACPQVPAAALSSDAGSAAASQKPIKLTPAILDKVTIEMRDKLSKKMTVLVNPGSQSIPSGATVISGCITRANAGNSAERLLGMGLGSSHLNVHVVALSRVKDGWKSVDTFDIRIKGGILFPPLGTVGLAIHMARDTQETLSADAKKLADKIVKRLATDMKAEEQVAKNG